MKKKVLSAVLALLLCVGMMPGALAAQTYSDVPEDFWAAKDIARATELGIFNGIGNGLFGLGRAITRAEFVTALVRMFGWERVVPAKGTFTDVTHGNWYYDEVETAVKNGAIPTSSKTFRPEDALSRGEMTAMLMRALGYTPLAATVSNYDCPFSDVVTNKGFITMAYDMGIVKGIGRGLFDPNTSAMREQAATTLVRLYDRLNAESTKLSFADDKVILSVATPAPEAGAKLPTTPLEPITQLYDALRKMQESGQDMSEVVLVLCAGGVRTIVDEAGEIISSDIISADKVKSILERTDVRVYYSQLYESAYCIYAPNNYQTVTVWYQSEESLAVKLQMARMFGVVNYVLE